MPESKQFVAEAVIASGETDSSVVNMSNFTLAAVEIPASMTSTALTFNVGSSSASVAPLKDMTDSAVSVTISNTAAVYRLDANDFNGFQYVQVVAGSSEGAARTLKLYGYKI